MSIKSLYILFFGALVAPFCSALTIFETFEYDVIANTSDQWIYSDGGDGSAGEITYIQGIASDGQFVRASLTKRGLPNFTWLYKNLPETLTTTSFNNAWFEFDFRVRGSNSAGGYSGLGLFKAGENTPASTNHILFVIKDSNKWSIYSCKYNIGAGTGTSSATGAQAADFILNQTYRQKTHFYRDDIGRIHFQSWIYMLGGESGNEETLVATGADQSIVPTGGGFTTGLTSIGITSMAGSTMTSRNNFDIDNLYFSTESSNTDTLAPFIQQPYQTVPDELAGLVGWWRFDNPSDLTLDYSGDNNGEVAGNCSWTADAFAGNGAIQFNNGYIRLYSCSNGSFSSEFTIGQATIAAWIKLDSANPSWPDNGFANMGAWCYPSVYPLAGDTLSLKLFLSYGEPVFVSLPLNTILTQWHHLAVTVDSNDIETGYKVYFDGELAGQFPMDGTYGCFLPADKPVIGASYNAADNTISYMHGKIDELYIYNRSLSHNEIKRLTHFSDFDYSDEININDIQWLVNTWLSCCSPPDWCLGTDINRDSIVDLEDFVYFAEQWMQIMP